MQSRGKSPFVLKRFRDFGGIHRILADNPELARSIDSCGPNSINVEGKEASLFTDLSVSGDQIADALNYYLAEEDVEVNPIFFSSSNLQRKRIGSIFRNLRNINLCFVLYTNDCVQRIKKTLIEHGVTATVEVSLGKNISASALLGTTNRMSVKAKADVVEFLQNEDVMDHLVKCVFDMSKSVRQFQKQKIKAYPKINLVARYHSMPKKALNFLSADLRGLPDTALFERVRELNEK